MFLSVTVTIFAVHSDAKIPTRPPAPAPAPLPSTNNAFEIFARLPRRPRKTLRRHNRPFPMRQRHPRTRTHALRAGKKAWLAKGCVNFVESGFPVLFPVGEHLCVLPFSIKYTQKLMAKRIIFLPTPKKCSKLPRTNFKLE